MAHADPNELRTHWPIVLTALVGIAVGVGTVPFYTIGIFAPVFVQVFGWSMGDIMLGLLIFSVSIIVVGPIVGRLADKYGARRLTLGSLVLYGISLGSFALNRGSLPFYYLSWTAMSVFGVGTTAITYTRVLNGWFSDHRGLALGIAFSGSGLFGIVGKPLTNILVNTFSWRAAFCVLGALPIVVALPLAIAFLRDPVSRVAPRQSERQGLGEVVFRWRFWLLALVYTLAAATTGGVIVSLENVLMLKGFNAVDLLRITPLLGFAIVIGELGTGILLDRLPTALVVAAQLTITVLCCIAFALPALTAPAAMAAVAGIGLSGAAMYTVLSFLTLRYFGITNYSAIFGTLTSFVSAGPALGGIILALSFDRLGTYAPVFWTAALLAGVSAVAIVAQDRAWLRWSGGRSADPH